jgi:hypothetical protein
MHGRERPPPSGLNRKRVVLGGSPPPRSL